MPGLSFQRFIPSVAIVMSLLHANLARAQVEVPVVPPLLQPDTASVLRPDDAAGVSSAVRTHEDLTSLGLADSDLVASAPVAGGHEENKDFVRDLFRVQWRSNDPIDLYVIRPKGVKMPPVALYLLSFPSDSERFLNPGFCRRLTENGVAAVGFVSALTGQRYGHRPMKQWFVSELPESLATTVHDVQMILNYLQARGDLDMGRVGMFGQGSGGAIAILSAAVDPRIKVLDLLEPWGDWPDFLAEAKLVPEPERPDYLKPEFLKKLEPLEPAHYLSQLKGRSIRIQFVEEKPPAKAVKAMELAAPPAAEVHGYTSSDELRSAEGGKLFQWIGDQLKPVAESGVPAQGR